MAIEKKLVCFKTQANFDAELAAGNIKDYSIVFIKDSQKIWTHGVYFSSLKELLEKLGKKQDILTAGDNIKIVTGTGDTLVISAEDTKYTLELSSDNKLLLKDSKGTEISKIELPAGGSVSQASDTKFGTVKLNTTPGEEGIKTDTVSLQTIPSGGTPNELLMHNGTKAVWRYSPSLLLNNFTYGIQWDIRSNTPTPTRIGSRVYCQTLPIQSGMRGCIYNPKEKRLVYWLDPDNWYFRKTPKYINGSIESPLIFKANPAPAVGLNEIRLSDLVKGQYVRAGKYVGIITAITSNNLIIKWQGISPHLERGRITKLEIGSRLDGYDGEVYVYVPEFWIKSWDDGAVKSVRISPIEIDNTWTHQPAVYVSAYRETVLKSVPPNMGYLSTLSEGVPVSIDNKNEYCRGGDGNTSFNNTEAFRNTLGKCITNLSRTEFRTRARKSGKEIMSYSQYKNILYWLWVIEYATFNVQLFNAGTFTDTDGRVYENVNSQGFHQGGLDIGISTMQKWEDYNKKMPIVPNGYTNEVGNRTNVKKVIIPSFDAGSGLAGIRTTEQTLYSTRWRGIEDPFSHIWQCVDGILIDTNTVIDGKYYQVFTTDNPSYYSDMTDATKNMTSAGRICNENGYIKEWDLGDAANILPKSVQLTPAIYKCGGYEQKPSTSNLLLLLGGDAESKESASMSAFKATEHTGTNKGLSYRTTIVTEDKF